MEYPVWYVPTLGGGLLIALVAILHVFISHFAVGGGLYLVMAERKGLREENPRILDFVHRHTRFFLLLTMVLGGLTGVAIWFIITLIHPAATSLLIHTFVFGWATEWVFFLVEIVALFVYYYTFGRMNPRTHQAIGWIYFASAWMSLFLINGILDFMLTPGQWLADGAFWSGFFNPTFWPSLFFRSFMAFMLAGCYGFLTATRLSDEATQRTMARYSGTWALGFLALSLPAGWWYLSALPQPAHSLVAGASPTIARASLVGAWSLALLAAAALTLVLVRPALRTRLVTVVVLVAALGYLGAFEWTREAARRPYVINQVMYSNGIREKDVERLDRQGFLATARWVRNRQVTEANRLEAGRELFVHQCYACHTVGGFNNDILARTQAMSYQGLRGYLATVHEKRPFMPPFVGTEEERGALAAFLTAGLAGKPLPTEAETAAPSGSAKGSTLFEENCAACHGADLLKPKLAGWTREKVRSALDGLSRLNEAMPDYAGSPAEKEALADYLYGLVGGAR